MKKLIAFDLTGPEVAGVLIAAAETEDEVGCLLRIQLLAEAFLANVFTRCASPEVQSFIGAPKYFGDKLNLAVCLGLPLPLASVLRQVNQMRNRLAHDGLAKEALPAEDLARLGQVVNALKAIRPEFEPVQRRYLETPEARPGRRMTFGGGDPRADLVIAFNAALGLAIEWLHGQPNASAAAPEA